MHSTNCASGMSGPRADRSAGGRRRPTARRAGRPAAVTLALTLLAMAWGSAPVAQAQVVRNGSGPVITRQVQESLRRLQEGWLRWTTSLYGDETEAALSVIEELMAVAQELGMEGLPDMSAGALQQAVEAARDGNTERAELALTAAERLAPGRPETAFAEAEVARLSGDFMGRVVAEVRGYVLAFGVEDLEGPLLVDLVLWFLVSLLVSGAFFVALLMFTRGRAVINGLGQGLARRLPFLPEPIIQVLMLAALLSPLALPWGPVWLALYWSLLLWHPALPSERSVLVALWLVAGLTPAVADELRVRLDRELSPPVRAMECVIGRQLYGDLFDDLGVLPATLPDDVAVDQFMGDLHARLGQWEVARQRYETVLDEEPENVSALVDLGAYYFNRGDYGNAVSRFQQAASIDPNNAAAYFDLNRSYNESYLYDEARAALVEARRIDDSQVTDWIGRSEGPRIVTAEGGFARKAEIEAALSEVWSPVEASNSSAGGQMLRRLRSLPLLVGILVCGFALLVALRRFGGGGAAGWTFQSSPVARRDGVSWRRLVPGLSSAVQGRGLRAFVGLFVPASLLTALAAAIGRGFSYSVPWRYDPGDWLLLTVSIGGLVLIVVVRAFRALRSRK